jgi:tRNA-uridine 2-sulfurtransferase
MAALGTIGDCPPTWPFGSVFAASASLNFVIELTGDSSRDGEWACVRLRVEGERIVEADAEGISERLEGLSLLEAAAVPGERLAADALANAIGPAVRAAPSAQRTAVAMSGGVDSAVALLRAGRDAVGVTLRLWLDPYGPAAERACCSPEAVITARETCHALGLPHVTLDLRQEFHRAVVRRFVDGYARGETPNPCTRCNGGFRFAQLLAFARRAGARRLATGHYARVVDDGEGELLARAADGAKDQSYMLATLDPARLDRVWFPLGDQDKEATRAEAAAAGLTVASRAESQEACFLAGGDYREFLERYGLAASDGPIVDEGGRELGRHTGHWRFTPGQRRGLGVATGSPAYALATDRTTNTVVVGPRESLARHLVEVDGRLYRPRRRVEAKLRYRSPAIPASIEQTADGRFTLHLDRPAHGVAAGQTAVLYDGDVVVGAGTITGARRT